ncbi:hypothetical protein PHYBLDRAFT_61515 [Phycomyces blakesleeanus NRRL 1555(-)]|uniref:Uncharacterized protein n=1 Tax=Phycomyces blakesleeanus (strain ATCC 8743b / DSM 1359 / FGSC 10004 / NBRC 33097 / NRRL 1555) TaxID=763407 RepID=A0A167QYB1_PHYB8|nr:hypothetical protein PHYBLDRAFT_61515 [Phycomyces blakesleeanus NRRL 1555(-)]OAD80464.1 hypothetical protein PHYBLDRAFT_61515 [Phycomyces blakesleeanus NRRL 1555(-)]|eukprot:XP_018298504.1 hypothetical protein PHYBLDRAFT_61515 [Phycomyces blakesleeanus NRRL 1555(-)]
MSNVKKGSHMWNERLVDEQIRITCRKIIKKERKKLLMMIIMIWNNNYIMICKLSIGPFFTTTVYLYLRDLVNLKFKSRPTPPSGLHASGCLVWFGLVWSGLVWSGLDSDSDSDTSAGLITDNVIQNLVHKISRDYNAVREFRLDYRLPLSTKIKTKSLLLALQLNLNTSSITLVSNLLDVQLANLCTNLEDYLFSLFYSNLLSDRQTALRIPFTIEDYVCDARTNMAYIEDVVVLLWTTPFLPSEQFESFNVQKTLFVVNNATVNEDRQYTGRNYTDYVDGLNGFLFNKQSGYQKRNYDRGGSSEMMGYYCTTKHTKLKQTSLETPIRYTATKTFCENKNNTNIKNKNKNTNTNTDTSMNKNKNKNKNMNMNKKKAHSYSPAHRHRTLEKVTTSIPKQTGVYPVQPILRVMCFWPA